MADAVPAFLHKLGACKEPLPNWTKDFPVIGQGTLVFSIERSSSFHIVVRPKLPEGESGSDNWIALSVSDNSATFTMRHNDALSKLSHVSGTVKSEPVGFDPDNKVSYWFSYNRDMLQLKYGKGYYMEETTLMQYDFFPKDSTDDEQKEIIEDYQYLFSPYIRREISQYDEVSRDLMVKEYANKILKSGLFNGKKIQDVIKGYAGLDEPERELKCEELAVTLIDIEKMVKFEENPFVVNWSPIVLDSNKVNLFSLDSNKFTFSASLPPACLELYSNVTSPDLNLDWPNTGEFKLSDAIQHSIDDTNGILHKKLESKVEFGSQNMTYLRVTCGPTRGKSAGIPYVLEIWPAGHGSPVHNHGNCYAVINVLYGGLTIAAYNKHTRTDDEDTPKLKEFDVNEGDVTWISPNWYQTHKLWNYHPHKYCATIQCYQYGKADLQRWPYFDYVADEDEIDEFRPDSDFTFREMRTLVMAEYIEHMNSQAVKCKKYERR